MSDNTYNETEHDYNDNAVNHLDIIIDDKDSGVEDTLRRAVNEGIKSFEELRSWLQLPDEASAREVIEACRQ